MNTFPRVLLALVAIVLCGTATAADPGTSTNARFKVPGDAQFDWQKVKCVCLEATRPITDKDDEDGDLLVREFARQAVLIAIRHGLGLPTRDQALGDPLPEPGNAEIALLQLTTRYLSPKRLELTLSRREGQREQRLWAATISIEPKAGQPGYLDLVTQLEARSRGELLEAFRKAGASVVAVGGKGKSPPDAAIADLLDRFRLFQQFEALRRLHARIQAEGETAGDLQGLVRAYANLGQLTQYHWTPAAKVCFARSLLYAQRLAALHGEPAARWHRSYALALAGLPALALEEFALAEKTPGAAAPPWAVMGKELCRYDFRALQARAEKGEGQTDLAWYLALRALGGDRSMMQPSIEVAQKLLANDPECYPAYFYLYRSRQLSLLQQSTLTAPAVLERNLARRLRACAGLPKKAADALESETALKDVPAALKAVGVSSAERGEPSWAVLGRMIQETVFLQVHTRAVFMRDLWTVPTSDYIQEALPLVEGHPYQGYIAALAFHPQREQAAFQQALQNLQLGDIELKAGPLFQVLQRVQRGDRTFGDIARRLAARHASSTNDDYLDSINYRLAPDQIELLQELRGVSPYNPIPVAELLRLDEPNFHTHLAVAEKDFAHHPRIVATLAETFEKRKQWAEAIVWQQKLVEAHGGYAAYDKLATLYERTGDDKKWQATLEEYLTKPTLGLDHAQVQVRLARRFMRQKDYAKAKPYAEAAAATYAEWALICAADCCEGLGDLDRSEQIMRQVSERYDDARTHWYFWCVRTGKGDLKAATEFASQHFASLKQLSLADGEAKAIGFLINGKPTEASKLLVKCFANSKLCYDALHLALIHDELGDAKARDAALTDAIDNSVKPAADSPQLRYVAAAKLLRSSLAEQKDLDLPAVEALLKDSPSSARTNVDYFVARFLELRGQKEKAVPYYTRSADSDDKQRWNCALASWRMRQMKEPKQPAEKPKK